MTFQLTSRTKGDGHKPGELNIATPTTAFCQVGADRHGRPPDLIGQAVLFAGWETLGLAVNVQGELIRQLPDFKFAKILHGCGGCQRLAISHQPDEVKPFASETPLTDPTESHPESSREPITNN